MRIIGQGGSIGVIEGQKVSKADETRKEERAFKEYRDNFGESIQKENPCCLVKHRIITDESKSVAKRGYEISYHWQNEIYLEIKKNLELGILSPSKSEWSSGIFPVRKKDGSLRLCIDYRPLNELTVKDRYPLPRIDEVIDRLSKAVVFSTLDAISSYHQFEIEEEDKHKTAFRFRGGFYEYNSMPFGLCNAPATFQRAMDGLFSGEHSKYVIPYLDDIIIFSESLEDHEKHLNIVMKILSEAGLVLNKGKCKLFREEVEVLGRIVSRGIVKPANEKVEALNPF